mmetsp:Transcript_20133/g.51260  ORF Transcript_20133/g.51260 Transcript_20133/m.51260 type:complete len:322 (-) Transcript_20133:150-1115(-)
MPTYGRIGRLLAVTSCKGGVGKSTVSLELAFRLSARGHRVGLYDADVQGPSLPVQVAVLGGDNETVRLGASGYSAQPLEYQGVKLMSFGWFSRTWGVSDGEVKGMAASLATNLLHTTEWGDLDYLIVDSPPGTGPIPKAIAKKIPLHGALVITTPSRLATVDVVRGIRMLQRLEVPVLAVVENMASYECGSCGTLHHPFGRGHLDEVLSCFATKGNESTSGVKEAPGGAGSGAGVGTGRRVSQPPSFSLPITADIGIASSGVAPFRAAHPASSLEAEFDALASSLELATERAEAVLLPHGLLTHELPHWPTTFAMNELCTE